MVKLVVFNSSFHPHNSTHISYCQGRNYIFLKIFLIVKQPADNTSADCFCNPYVLYISPFLQMLVPWDPVVPFKQERLDHRGQLHVKVEEIDRKCDYEECKSSGHKIK